MVIGARHKISNMKCEQKTIIMIVNTTIHISKISPQNAYYYYYLYSNYLPHIIVNWVGGETLSLKVQWLQFPFLVSTYRIADEITQTRHTCGKYRRSSGPDNFCLGKNPPSVPINSHHRQQLLLKYLRYI